MKNKWCRSIDPVERYGTDFTVRYELIDTILEAAINSSLHNIPAKTFPDTAMKWNKHIGRRLFSAINVEIVSEGLDEEEEEDAYDIIRSDSPTRSKVTVWSALKEYFFFQDLLPSASP